MYNTYDRFLGSWWGGVIGQTFLNHSANLLPENVLGQSWVERRSQTGAMLLKAELESDYAGLEPILQNINEEAEANNDLQHNSSLLSLLPLIIFSSDRYSFSSASWGKHNLKSANSLKDSYVGLDILSWAYLLTIVLNSRPNLLTQKLATERISNYGQAMKSPAMEKIKLVERAIESNTSLDRLAAELSAQTGLRSMAIALSWYCFIATPNDSRLSIQRAALVEPNLAWLTTALTGTLSGAYNGMARISVNWRSDKELEIQENREYNLLTNLFKSWLGIYALDLNVDVGVNAVAMPRLIQPRQELKIISQSSFL